MTALLQQTCCEHISVDKLWDFYMCSVFLKIIINQYKSITTWYKCCRAVHELWKDSIKIYQCVDVSRDMNETAEYLLRSNVDVFIQFKTLEISRPTGSCLLNFLDVSQLT
jgi:ABC-type uncharacterized transport system fused permease/ATPase subunit